jgi:hypothetical protein
VRPIHKSMWRVPSIIINVVTNAAGLPIYDYYHDVRTAGLYNFQSCQYESVPEHRQMCVSRLKKEYSTSPLGLMAYSRVNFTLPRFVCLWLITALQVTSTNRLRIYSPHIMRWSLLGMLQMRMRKI